MYLRPGRDLNPCKYAVTKVVVVVDLSGSESLALITEHLCKYRRLRL